ncbi:class I SAM-dependent methyltransferase [Marinicella meishanensis]|uniref:class I SAM-dependent methyltransferase n=1 Tax=Marinicella meishanensis TaxID=2873263 RepID=UPI001CBF0ADF|nr:class I SAM-dependent methyltransferase [Marinicella sp. NBU2979]
MERYVPQKQTRYHSWYEHWHRYYFIAEIVKDRRVCDVACGEGYGSALLAKRASEVVGVDVDKATIQHANETYGDIENVEFIVANATETQFIENSFDVIVSFETLEHLSEHQQLIREFKRILKKDGLLIISTPDKLVYSGDKEHNEYHVKELTKLEFEDLMKSEFKYNMMYGQKLQLFSVIEQFKLDKHDPDKLSCVVEETDDEPVKNGPNSLAKYLIMIGSDNPDTIDNLDLSTVHSFSDKENQLLNHYDMQIQRLIEIDKQNHELLKTIDQQKYLIGQLMSRIGL